jgi:hypothetical protein
LLNNVKAKTYKRSDKTGSAGDETHVGFIAQDVAAVLPPKFKNLTSTVEWNEEDVLTINYNKMIAILWSIVKDQNERLKKIEKHSV